MLHTTLVQGAMVSNRNTVRASVFGTPVLSPKRDCFSSFNACSHAIPLWNCKPCFLWPLDDHIRDSSTAVATSRINLETPVVGSPGSPKQGSRLEACFLLGAKQREMQFVPKKPTNCNLNCCVPQCHSLAKRDRTLSFHNFPNSGEKCQREGTSTASRAEWIRVLRIGKPVTKTMRVCSKHFKKEDYFFPGK